MRNSPRRATCEHDLNTIALGLKKILDGRSAFWCTKFTPAERCRIRASLTRKCVNMLAVGTDLRNPKKLRTKCERKFFSEMINECFIPRTHRKIVDAHGLQNPVLRVSICLQIRINVFMLVCRPSWPSNIRRSLQ
jgi:hypothetical protein